MTNPRQESSYSEWVKDNYSILIKKWNKINEGKNLENIADVFSDEFEELCVKEYGESFRE